MANYDEELTVNELLKKDELSSEDIIFLFDYVINKLRMIDSEIDDLKVKDYYQ